MLVTRYSALYLWEYDKALPSLMATLAKGVGTIPFEILLRCESMACMSAVGTGYGVPHFTENQDID